MQITASKPAFAPIQVTIETEEERDLLLWALEECRVAHGYRNFSVQQRGEIKPGKLSTYDKVFQAILHNGRTPYSLYHQLFHHKYDDRPGF